MSAAAASAGKEAKAKQTTFHVAASAAHAAGLGCEQRTAMKVRPLHDRVIIERIEDTEQKIGAIIIPDSAKEKPQQGKIIAAGKGRIEKDGRVTPLDVKAGDTILFGKYAGQEIKIEGHEYLIMREEEVLGVIETK
jgi:chaperonin GroES